MHDYIYNGSTYLYLTSLCDKPTSDGSAVISSEYATSRTINSINKRVFYLPPHGVNMGYS